MKNKQRSLKIESILLTAGCFLSFFLFGFTDNLKGPTLPAMLAELNIQYGTGGNIFFGEYLGFVIATLATGILAEKYGMKPVLLFAGIALTLGVLGYSALPTAPQLGLSLFIIGLAFGALELGANSLIVLLHPQKKGLFLNLLAVLHGLGSTAAPIYAGWMLAQGSSWRLVFRWDIPLIILFIAIVAALQFPTHNIAEKINFSNIRKAAFQNHLPYYHAAIAFYVAAEIGSGAWMVAYLQESRGWDITSSSNALALFFAAIMIGRLLGGFLVQRIGYLHSILLASIGALAVFLLGAFTPYAQLLPLAGLFLSIIFPTITAAASDEIRENQSTALGILFTFAGVGSIFGPLLVAWVNELAGISYTFVIISIFTALIIPPLLIILKGTADGKNS